MFEPLSITGTDTPKLDFEAIKEKTFVDLSVKQERPEIVISIGDHEYKGKSYPTSVMTAGEFSMIVAPSKTKKSFLKSAFSGAFLGGNSKKYFDNIIGHRKNDNEAILDFDTEQAKYYAAKTFSRALEISGMESYKHYYPYMLRTLSPKERIAFIEFLIYNTPNLRLVFIDGIADLVNDTNDLAESVELASRILKWTAELQIHICVIMHSAYGTEKATGHLGSTLIKKSESVILLKPTDDTKKYIETAHQYSRGYAFENFYFSIKNQDAMPYRVDGMTYEFPISEGDTVENMIKPVFPDNNDWNSNNSGGPDVPF